MQRRNIALGTPGFIDGNILNYVLKEFFIDGDEKKPKKRFTKKILYHYLAKLDQFAMLVIRI